MSLKALLDMRNMSMYRLAKLSGVSKTVIIDICSGKSALENCTAKTVYQIATVLDCSVEDLLKIYLSDTYSEVNNMKESTKLKSINYITGIHALNLSCSLDTSGDWHASALSWESPNIKNTEKSVWGCYGIELCDNVPENPGKHFVANHIRACLDLLEDGRFSVAQSMRKDFIGNDKYDREIFLQVLKLKSLPGWNAVRDFMKKEYRSDWIDFERSNLYV